MLSTVPLEYSCLMTSSSLTCIYSLPLTSAVVEIVEEREFLAGLGQLGFGEKDEEMVVSLVEMGVDLEEVSRVNRV
ncbi:hypothetical protein PanWU01x14_089470 [Parasponia andersonii]|uniref:Uncharacterized protein n=1 Tax=Parasponia andersonii TaxID=3476 RepID=A0A2P5D7G1_PARAD|nr:hypothetical protein PanWU01x14_089470 [Parasponia andersonii]